MNRRKRRGLDRNLGRCRQRVLRRRLTYATCYHRKCPPKLRSKPDRINRESWPMDATGLHRGASRFLLHTRHAEDMNATGLHRGCFTLFATHRTLRGHECHGLEPWTRFLLHTRHAEDMNATGLHRGCLTLFATHQTLRGHECHGLEPWMPYAFCYTPDTPRT